MDAAVLKAYEDLAKNPDPRTLRARLMSIVRHHVRAQVGMLRKRHEYGLSKEEDVPETPPEEWVYRLGEEIFDFFEPEEDLKVEDVVPDLDVPTPEEEAHLEDTQRCVDPAQPRGQRQSRQQTGTAPRTG